MVLPVSVLTKICAHGGDVDDDDDNDDDNDHDHYPNLLGAAAGPE